MKIDVVEIPVDQEEALIINCHNQQSEWVLNVKNAAQNEMVILGKKDSLSFRVSLKDVYYFESVDDRSFIYTGKNVYETGLKLYELEELSKNCMFFRASKSAVVNIRKIKCLKPSFSGKFELTLMNDYKIMVSRHYVTDLKRIMDL